MNKEEKEIVVGLLNAEIASMKALKFKYGGKPTSFNEAMCLSKLRLSNDEELNRLLDIDNEIISKKAENKLIQLKTILKKINNL